MNKCILFFAFFVLAVMTAAIIGDEEQVDLIEEVSEGEPEMDDLIAQGG